MLSMMGGGQGAAADNQSSLHQATQQLQKHTIVYYCWEALNVDTVVLTSWQGSNDRMESEPTCIPLFPII